MICLFAAAEIGVCGGQPSTLNVFVTDVTC